MNKFLLPDIFSERPASKGFILFNLILTAKLLELEGEYKTLLREPSESSNEDLINETAYEFQQEESEAVPHAERLRRLV